MSFLKKLFGKVMKAPSCKMCGNPLGDISYVCTVCGVTYCQECGEAQDLSFRIQAQQVLTVDPPPALRDLTKRFCAGCLYPHLAGASTSPHIAHKLLHIQKLREATPTLEKLEKK